MNDERDTIRLIRSLARLDRRLAYKCKQPNETDWATYRWRNGHWEAHITGIQKPVQMTNIAVRRQLKYWAGHCGRVQMFACCCASCLTPEIQAFHNEVSRVSHGYWPECYDLELLKLFSVNCDQVAEKVAA